MANEVIDVIMEATDTTGRKKKRQFTSFDPTASEAGIYTFMTNMNNLTTRQYIKSTMVSHKPILQPHITPSDLVCSFSTVITDAALFTISTVLQTLKAIYYKTESMAGWSTSSACIDNIEHTKDPTKPYRCAIIDATAGIDTNNSLTVKVVWDADGEYYAGEQEFTFEGGAI